MGRDLYVDLAGLDSSLLGTVLYTEKDDLARPGASPI